MAKFLDYDGLLYFWQQLKSKFVAQETGKGLSTNDFTTAEKNKLAGIAAGAEVNVNADWNASSGDAQILNKPSIPSASSTTPKMDGTAAVGTGTTWARADHVHPHDTSKQDTLTFDSTPTANSSNPVTSAGVKTYVDDAIGGITGIDFQIVTTLPSTGQTGTIYLVSNGGASGNSYDEYIWLASASKFEKIGTTDVDLSNYWNTTNLTAITNTEIDTIMAA